MLFDLAVVDLDNTLYAAGSGVFERMDKRMTRFVARELGVEAEEANRLRLLYWRQYGTTLRGLILHHGVEPEPFLDEVHDIGVHEMLQPDAALDAALADMPGRKVIHTNGTREHAERVLSALGIRRHFASIYDIRFNTYTPKPCANTLRTLLDAEAVLPVRALIIDDMEDNLVAAQSIGAQTALISGARASGTWTYHADSFTGLCQLIRQAEVS